MENEKKLEIELNAEVADGIYSNLALIAHSQSEFVIDFARLVPGVQKARVKSRIILTPQHAKRLMMALTENIRKYESSFGEIKEPAPGAPVAYMNIPAAEA